MYLPLNIIKQKLIHHKNLLHPSGRALQNGDNSRGRFLSYPIVGSLYNFQTDGGGLPLHSFLSFSIEWFLCMLKLPSHPSAGLTAR